MKRETSPIAGDESENLQNQTNCSQQLHFTPFCPSVSRLLSYICAVPRGGGGCLVDSAATFFFIRHPVVTNSNRSRNYSVVPGCLLCLREMVRSQSCDNTALMSRHSNGASLLQGKAGRRQP